jgi:L-rhamnose mutarotase
MVMDAPDTDLQQAGTSVAPAEDFHEEPVPGSNGNSKGHLKRVCFILQVKPERLEEYKRRHGAVWPEMLAALRESGWNNYSLFLRADGLLIGYLETEDFERARAEMARREVNKRWQNQMAAFFVQPEGLLPDQAMEFLEEIFHL